MILSLCDKGDGNTFTKNKSSGKELKLGPILASLMEFGPLGPRSTRYDFIIGMVHYTIWMTLMAETLRTRFTEIASNKTPLPSNAGAVFDRCDTVTCIMFIALLWFNMVMITMIVWNIYNHMMFMVHTYVYCIANIVIINAMFFVCLIAFLLKKIVFFAMFSCKETDISMD